MLSLDRADRRRRTAIASSFRSGEVYDGQPIVDRQHPHDFVMQAAVVWRVPIDYRDRLHDRGRAGRRAGARPIAFMHRPSAAENPAAPLGHHTLDSTHIAMGVVTAALDHGPFTIETSLFNGARAGRQPLGRDGSGPARLVVRRARGTSRHRSGSSRSRTAILKQPEALEPGDIRRTTASASWFKRRGDGFTAVDGRRRPQRHRPRRLQRAARRSDRAPRQQRRSTDGSSRAEGNRVAAGADECGIDDGRAR